MNCKKTCRDIERVDHLAGMNNLSCNFVVEIVPVAAVVVVVANNSLNIVGSEFVVVVDNLRTGVVHTNDCSCRFLEGSCCHSSKHRFVGMLLVVVGDSLVTTGNNMNCTTFFFPGL